MYVHIYIYIRMFVWGAGVPRAAEERSSLRGAMCSCQAGDLRWMDQGAELLAAPPGLVGIPTYSNIYIYIYVIVELQWCIYIYIYIWVSIYAYMYMYM